MSKKFSFLLYVDRVHEKGNLTFSLDIPAPTPLNYVHSHLFSDVDVLDTARGGWGGGDDAR